MRIGRRVGRTVRPMLWGVRDRAHLMPQISTPVVGSETINVVPDNALSPREPTLSSVAAFQNTRTVYFDADTTIGNEDYIQGPANEPHVGMTDFTVAGWLRR